MNFIHALVLGIVEGFTEFLPISSTAHMILASRLMNLTQTDFMKSFEVVIQFGAILSVVVLYWKKFLNWEVIKRLVVAFIPTGILGLIFYKIVKQFLMGNNFVILGALLLGGIFIIVFEKFYKCSDKEEKLENISYKQCLLIGCFQAIAMIPGVSRSASTIIGGLLLGLNRKNIVEFSFLLAVPTMLIASAYDLYKNMDVFSADNIGLLSVGFVVSFITAIISIKFLLSFIRKRSFTAFGIYRIIIVAIFILIFYAQIG